MRVHRTMCSGHRPLSSPRPMAAPAARHRPSPERSGRRLPEPRLRLRAAPSRDPAPAGRADARARCGAARQPGGGPGGRRARGGPRRPRGAAQEAGSCPWRARARGCLRSVRASDSLNFTRAPRGKQETPRQQLGRTSRRPRAFSLHSASSPPLSPDCQSCPRDRPLRGLWQTFSCPRRPQEFLARSIYPGVTEGTRFRKALSTQSVYTSQGTPTEHLPPPRSLLCIVPRCSRIVFSNSQCLTRGLTLKSVLGAHVWFKSNSKHCLTKLRFRLPRHTPPHCNMFCLL